MQKEIQLTDKTLLVVGLPKEASNLVVDGNGSSTVRLSFYDSGWDWIKLPKGEWQLLGIYPELTEEQASRVIEKHKVAKDKYRDFTKTYFNSEWLWTYKTALESFQSLMERENITGYDKYAILIKSK